MKRQYFGTDGVRGVYGGPLMNDTFAWRLGCAAGRWLSKRGVEKPAVIIGKDTRFSGPALERALALGLAATGAHPMSAGVVPTPAVSLAVRHFRAALGIVVTASHNPAEDNGIKFFSAAGTKLDDADEVDIESLLPAPGDVPMDLAASLPALEAVGAEELYIETLARVLEPGALSNICLVLDVCNGASCRTSPAVLRRLGARVDVLADEPDGTNINARCGSQHPANMQARVLELGAVAGIAHDGDADRLIMADETGAVLDGDEILAILADDALRAGRLNHRTLVATVQSNLGLRHFMEGAGGALVQTAVGDRYVSEAMIQGGFNLGGESSGHVICTDVSPCGDGLAAALLVLRAMLARGKPLSELRRLLSKFPQETRALRVSSRPPIETLPALSSAIRAAEDELASKGRVLVRYSGTEPKIRLLVEAPSSDAVGRVMEKLVAALRRDLPEA